MGKLAYVAFFCLLSSATGIAGKLPAPPQNQESSRPQQIAQKGMLSDIQSQYCALIANDDVARRKSAHDYLKADNDLQREAYKRAEQKGQDDFNAALRNFWNHNKELLRWSVEYDPGLKIIDNHIVRVDFRIQCDGNKTVGQLITVASRRDIDVITLLGLSKTHGSALVSGIIREIAPYRDYEQSSWSPLPAYITFTLTSISPVAGNGTIGTEAKSSYAADAAIARALAAAAADASERDEYERVKMRTKIMQRVWDSLGIR